MKKNISHLPAKYFIKGTGINKQTFYQRIILRDIAYIQLFNSDRLYSVKDWNLKCNDYKLLIDMNE